jgi:hypothetical protein
MQDGGTTDYLARRVIRTTAAVQQGNSGGGLFNGAGELIGIIQSKPFYTGTTEKLPVDNIAYAVPTDIAVRIALQMAERDGLGYSSQLSIGEEKDCLLLPYVGITLDWVNRHTNVEDGLVFFSEDILVKEISNECKLPLVSGDIIKQVECAGKVLLPSQYYQIREFLIECYSAEQITIWVEREGSLVDIKGPLAGVTSGR